MHRVREMARKAAASECPVLIAGETGTGKGLCAELIHGASRRASSPLVVVDGTLLHEELTMSQLFGHVRGAFTGANEARPGLVAGAEGGTLFIDEISDASPRMQAALLRLLDEKIFLPVGATSWQAVDCRVVCASRRNLRRLSKDGGFREDLLFRISCLDIKLPPLRERGRDVLLLAESFLRELSRTIAVRNG